MMSSETVFCFVTLLSMVVLINGQTSNPHFCEALESNRQRIDYSLSQPQWTKSDFYHLISIRGYVWTVLFDPSTGVSLESETGIVLVTDTLFWDAPYVCAFGVRYRKIDRINIGGLTRDYRKIIWIHVKPKTNRKKRQLNNTRTTPDPKWVNSFETGFNEIDFKPQMAFNTMSNVDKNIVYFLETRSANNSGTYKSSVQAFSIDNPKDNINRPWVNETTKEAKNVPIAVQSVASKYLIKGFMPIKMSGSKNGGIILLEICPTEEIPCSGTVSYEYCVVADDEPNPTDDGKPCHRNNIKPLYDCSYWKSKAGRPDAESTTQEDESSSTEALVFNAAEEATNGSTTSIPSEEPKSGMGWLWILILLIVIILIIIIILCLCCRKGKGDKDTEAPADAGSPPSSGVTIPSSLSSTSARSGITASNDQSKGGTMSSMSTASARSNVMPDSGATKPPASAKPKLSKNSTSAGVAGAPSSLSTASARSHTGYPPKS